jgi:hypothetical protein
MNHTDVLDAVNESFADVHLNRPLETVLAAGRARRHRMMAVRTSVAAVAVAALGVGALSLSGLSTPAVHNGGSGPGIESQHNVRPAAFTLVSNADGSVTFTVHDVVDPGAATKALGDAGITGRVVNLRGDQGCTTEITDFSPTDFYPDDTNTWAFRRGQSTATFRSSDYPPGGGLLLVVIKNPPQPNPRSPDPALQPIVAILAFDDATKIPTCMNSLDAGPTTGK